MMAPPASTQSVPRQASRLGRGSRLASGSTALLAAIRCRCRGGRCDCRKLHPFAGAHLTEERAEL